VYAHKIKKIRESERERERKREKEKPVQHAQA
jgi:hypothetical protein